MSVNIGQFTTPVINIKIQLIKLVRLGINSAANGCMISAKTLQRKIMIHWKKKKFRSLVHVIVNYSQSILTLHFRNMSL